MARAAAEIVVRCERPECGERFWKNLPKQRFCSRRCANTRRDADVSAPRTTAKGGRGGRRAGSGRKPLHKLIERCCERPSCAQTFKPTSRKKRFCSKRCSALIVLPRGPRGGIRHSTRACDACRRPFAPKTKHYRFCSASCFQEWIRTAAANPQKTETVRATRRRACRARRAAGYRLEPGRWRRICDRDNWVCWICHRAIDPTLKVPDKGAGTADHAVALATGGDDTDANLRAAHLSCNSRRGRGRFVPNQAVA